MRRTIKNVALSLFVLWASAPVFPQVVEEDGETIEFLGLKRWTIEQVRDSLKSIAPEEQLGHCAVPLKYQLHFPDVSVEYTIDPSDTSRPYIVVTVIEPQDSMYVKRVACYPSSYSLTKDWRDFKDQYRKNEYERTLAVRYFLLDSMRAMKEVEQSGADAKIFVAIRQSLSHLPVQISKMIRLATESYDVDTRQVAIMALGAHPENDSSWYSLIRALRDISDPNTGFAGAALTGFAENTPRRINWKPAYDDLQCLFNGTNLFLYVDLLNLFSRVGYTEDDFRAIFNTRHSRDLLIAQLMAKHPKVQRRVIDFLLRIKPDFERLSDSERVNYIFGV